MNRDDEVDDEFDLLDDSSLILNDHQLGLSLEISEELFRSLVDDNIQTIDLDLLDELARLPDSQFEERLLLESLLESEESEGFWPKDSYEVSTDDAQSVHGDPLSTVQVVDDEVSASEAELALKDVVRDIETDSFLAEEDTVPEAQGADGTSTYLCPVCGNQNGRHAHYGGYSCASCRAFFRRSVQSKAYVTFMCKAQNCKINSKSWKSCKSCRFKKCLMSGMKPQWVLDKNERNSKTPKRTLADMATTVSTFNVSRSLEFGFTNDELLKILSQADCRKMNMSNSLLNFYSTNPSLFKHLARAVYKNSLLPSQTFQHLESKWPCTQDDFVLKETELGLLSDEDSINLLNANFPLLQIFVQSVVMVNGHHFKATPLGNLLKRSITVNPQESDQDSLHVLNGILKDLSLNNRSQHQRCGITYNQVFASPWAESRDLEQRHAKLTKEMSSWPINPKDPARHVDKVQVFLLANIIMLSTDNAKVSNPKQVGEIQSKYLMMLHRYLKYKYKEKYNSVFAKGLMISSLAKEAKAIRARRLPV